MTRLLIDGDLLVYRCAYAVENKKEKTIEPLENAFHIGNNLMQKIFINCDSLTYDLYLTSTDYSNFRFNLNKDYKANRGDKPTYYNEMREYLINKWKAEIIYGAEADDKLGVEQCLEHYKPWGEHDFDSRDRFSIIVAQDKDLNNIPGWHYNPVTDTTVFITEKEAMRNFYKQILIGDASDNVKGVEGIGKKKAELAINPLHFDQHMFDKCVTLCYTQMKWENKKQAYDYVVKVGQLLWISRLNLGELWEPPLSFDEVQEEANG